MLYQLRNSLFGWAGQQELHGWLVLGSFLHCGSGSLHSNMWGCSGWKLWIVPNSKLCSCEQSAWAVVSEVMHLSFTLCFYNSKVTVSACQMSLPMCRPLAYDGDTQQDGMQWKATSVCNIGSECCKTELPLGNPESEAFCETFPGTSVGTRPPAEEISQDELLFT